MGLKLRLRHLTLHSFRMVVPGCALEFGPSQVAVLGRNGTGKTTLLELLAGIWSWDLSAFAEEEFDLEYVFDVLREDGGVGRIEVRARNVPTETQTAVVDPPRTRSPIEPRWREEVRIDANGLFENQLEPLVVQLREGEAHVTPRFIATKGKIGTSLVRLNYRGLGDEFVYWLPKAIFILQEFVNDQTATDGWGGRQFALPNSEGARIRYPEDNSWFSAAQSGLELNRYFQEGSLGLFSGSWAPHDLVRKTVDATPLRPPFPDSLTFARRNVAFLDSMCKAADLKDIDLRLELESGARPAKPGDWQQLTYRNASLYVTRKDGSRFPAANLSYGQRRLLGLHWYLALVPGVAIIDELANGLHYDLVENILDAIADRQSFLAMQDPLVLDHMRFDSQEALRGSFVLCETASDEAGREGWSWRNFSPEESQDVYESWTVGIQHVHDILRTRGLW